MASSHEPVPEPGLEAFLGEPTEDLDQWTWLWEGDHRFPVQTHRGGLVGKLVLALKRVFAPLVRAPQADLWERQRVFNLISIRQQQQSRAVLQSLAGDLDTIGKDLQTVQQEIMSDMRAIQSDINGNVKGLSHDLDDFRRKGMVDVMRHTDALFSRLDQKIDRLRREAGEASDRLQRRPD